MTRPRPDLETRPRLPLHLSTALQLEDNSSAAQIAAAQQVAASQQAAQASLASGGFGPDHPQTLEDLLREAEAGEDG
jgi:hypothetical protein